MEEKEAPMGPDSLRGEPKSLPQPEDEPLIEVRKPEEIKEKFRREDHVSISLIKWELKGPYYQELKDKFEPDSDEYYYVDKKEMADGIYSGYMVKDEALGEIRKGPGTLVHSSALWRMEGYWLNNEAF